MTTAGQISYLDALAADRYPAPTVTAWTYSPRDGERIADGAMFSGIGPVGATYVARELAITGHVVIFTGERPWRHHVVGCGAGHDDAQFCEAGTSYAVYCESGEAFDGAWWDWDAAKLGRYFELITTDELRHLAACAAEECGECARIRASVSQLQVSPRVACATCGRMSRDLIDGTCGRCHDARVFA